MAKLFLGFDSLLLNLVNIKLDFSLISATMLPFLHFETTMIMRQRKEGGGERDILIAGFLRISSEGQPAKCLF